MNPCLYKLVYVCYRVTEGKVYRRIPINMSEQGFNGKVEGIEIEVFSWEMRMTLLTENKNIVQKQER